MAAGQAGPPNALGGSSGTGMNIAAEGSSGTSAASAAQGAQATGAAANERAAASQAAQTAQRGAQATGFTPTGSSTAQTTQEGQAASQTTQTTQTTQAAQSSQSAQTTQAAMTQANANFNGQAAAVDLVVEQGVVGPGSQASGAASTIINRSPAELQDTLKGLLLQLAASQDMPPALKEAAQQLIQHLTGQQLLLNTDRTAPFAQVTMFIPLHGADGQQTASVHIQSRRGRKGELDAKNCRLWFDLDMKHLGPTVIDVHVVDRIVSLHMRNDQPWVAELIESKKQELAAGVESIGYQLLGIKTSPFPEITEPESDTFAAGAAVDYTPQTYKGVDYRV